MFKIKSSTYYISITWKKKSYCKSHTVNINIIYNEKIRMVLEVEYNPDFYAIIFPFSFVNMWQH